MWYVYILRSVSYPSRTYTGLTADLRRRFAEHNAGKSPHTRKCSPWKLVTYCAFANKQRAERFEAYLKSGSGRAFARRHLE